VQGVPRSAGAAQRACGIVWSEIGYEVLSNYNVSNYLIFMSSVSAHAYR
jgi:hypothetical protein